MQRVEASLSPFH